MSTYTLGQMIRVSAVVKDITGALVDPATIAATAQTQDGVETGVTSAHDGTGLYHFDWQLSAHGFNTIRVVTTNPVGAAELQVNVATLQ